MAESAGKVPVQFEKSFSRIPQQWQPFERFRREIDRLFDDFTGGLLGGSLFDPRPFRRAEGAFRTMPAVDVAETDKAYEIKAELPGLDEKNIEVSADPGSRRRVVRYRFCPRGSTVDQIALPQRCAYQQRRAAERETSAS
jgi:HSP20 family protein